MSAKAQQLYFASCYLGTFVQKPINYILRYYIGT